MINKLGVMVDCSRNSVMTVAATKRLIDKLSIMGYRVLGLYTEDTFEVNNEPHFGCLRGRYTKKELKELERYALSKGVTLKPYIQTLAHLNQIFLWDEYYAIKDIDDILLIGDERTYELIDHIFQTLAECFTAREVNIGMDEAHHVGRGAYLDKHGYEIPVELMKLHLVRVLEIAEKYGFTCEMWGDMFYNMSFKTPNATEESVHCVSEKIPRGLKLAVWDYYGLKKEDYIKALGHYRWAFAPITVTVSSQRSRRFLRARKWGSMRLVLPCGETTAASVARLPRCRRCLLRRNMRAGILTRL